MTKKRNQTTFLNTQKLKNVPSQRYLKFAVINLHFYNTYFPHFQPFLLDGYKFDLRIYVLVLSCDPLRIFVYKDGLVRLATTKYKSPTGNNIVSTVCVCVFVDMTLLTATSH